MKALSKKTNAEIFLEYVNDWLTISEMAAQYDMDPQTLQDIIEQGNKERKLGIASIERPKGREFHYENEMCQAVGLRTSCNCCNRIIWKDEFDPKTYYPLGYCPQCAAEAEKGVEPGNNNQSNL